MKKLLLTVMVAVTLLATGSFVNAADTGTVNINATVVGTCKFTTNTANINVTLDPSVSSNVTGNGSLAFWCTKNANYTVTDNDGQYETGPNLNRVFNSTANEYIPYTFTYTPTSGTGAGPQNPITLNVSATFAYTDFQNASAGTYTDIVTITVNP
ncbi:MAG: spore coat U domain-containing protein [Proteobacteria bacterium]|nr:spore coat U domain-containing protein [Pseudomonadota bacterium]